MPSTSQDGKKCEVCHKEKPTDHEKNSEECKRLCYGEAGNICQGHGHQPTEGGWESRCKLCGGTKQFCPRDYVHEFKQGCTDCIDCPSCTPVPATECATCGGELCPDDKEQPYTHIKYCKGCHLDGCGKAGDYDCPPPASAEGWEERFAALRKGYSIPDTRVDCKSVIESDLVEGFIRSELEKAKAEGRREQREEDIRTIKKLSDGPNDSWDSAIDEAINSISE